MRLGGAFALALWAAACGRIDFDAGGADAARPLRLFLWAAGDPVYPPGNTDLLLGEITSGATFDVGPYALGGVTAVAEVDPALGPIDRVVFTAGGRTATETDPPYTLGGEDGADLRRASDLYIGPNVVRAVARDASGAMLAEAEVDFTLTVPLEGIAITAARVIDNATGDPITTLEDAMTYSIPAGADIELVTMPAIVGRVEILSDPGGAWVGRREDWPPYHVAGDQAVLTLASGTYRLRATPYSFGGAGGVAGPPLDITFAVE